MPEKSFRRGATPDLLLLFLLSLFWGTSYVFVKLAVSELPALTVATGRTAIGAIVLAGAARLLGQGLGRQPALWRHAFAVGIFSSALPFFLIAWGGQRIESALMAILMATAPLIALCAAHFGTADEKMTPRRVAAMALGFGGVMVLTGIDALRSVGDHVWGQLAIAGAAACYGVAAVVARRMPQAPLLTKGASTLLCASALLLPLAAYVDQPWRLDISLVPGLSIVVLGVFATAVAMILYFHLVTTVGATFTASCNHLIPVIGVAAGAIVFGESLHWRVPIALGMILGGIALGQCVGPRPLRQQGTSLLHHRPDVTTARPVATGEFQRKG